MTPDQLSDIRALHAQGYGIFGTDLRALLDEVERLRAAAIWEEDRVIQMVADAHLRGTQEAAERAKAEVERLTTLLAGTEAVLENEREYQTRLKAEVGQLASESFRRGVEAIRELTAQRLASVGGENAATYVRALPVDIEADRAFDAMQPSFETPVPPERRIRRQADVDAAFTRGAEAMRTALLQRVSWDSDLADRIRAEPVPEDR